MKSILYLLREFNFTESEAKVYIALLESNACTGYEISKLSGVARSKIYNVLEALLQRGAITSSQGEKNILYRAESISQLTSAIRNRLDTNLSLLEDEACKLAEPQEDEHIWQMYDWDAVKIRCEQMISGAKSLVMMQIWTNELDSSMEKCIIAKQKELERVLVILYDEKEQYNTKIPKVYKHGFEQDKLDDMGGRWLLISVDNREMIYVSLSSSGMTNAIFTKDPNMALFAREYVYHDAYCLRLIDHFREQVVSDFGENMEGIRDVFSL